MTSRRIIALPPALQRYFTEEELAALKDMDPVVHARVAEMLEELPREMLIGICSAALMHTEDPIEHAARLCNLANRLKLTVKR